ncbi:MAG: glutaminyl-peptide cyclotransferase [Bacteroidetes bacterium]|nr:glutaminyl-peptide cyclotransferase [Bacteroidota bacterium]
MKKFLAILLVFAFVSCNNTDNPGEGSVVDKDNPAPPAISYQVVKIYPHDTASYTQGLIWQNGKLYEGTGLTGKSKLRIIHIDKGTADKEINLPANEFGEGITIFNNKIYQLTWQNNRVHEYDAGTFQKIRDFDWPFQGWGITHNENELIVSTGSSNLYFVDPVTFKVKKIVGVTDNLGPVGNLNELEYIQGSIFANVYETNYIIKIDPETGKVLGKLDLTGLMNNNGVRYNAAYLEEQGGVLNGIAYDSTKNTLLITGKLWPALFELKIN